MEPKEVGSNQESVNFLLELFTDETEKAILALLSEDLDPEQILEQLLKKA
jgi:hypothetical protein